MLFNRETAKSRRIYVFGFCQTQNQSAHTCFVERKKTTYPTGPRITAGRADFPVQGQSDQSGFSFRDFVISRLMGRKSLLARNVSYLEKRDVIQMLNENG
ncbi:MAG TPA: hypothetical protein PKV71_17215, partial [Calditrichia bacterium]|nr:hypothetical protein [Calditrichia bacterium]